MILKYGANGDVKVLEWDDGVGRYEDSEGYVI